MAAGVMGGSTISTAGALRALPYLTAEVPGIDGVIRSAPEDFRVVERPLYLPCGEGEHLYLRVTKRGMPTPELVRRLSSLLGVKVMGIGVAGLKDANAVTTQLVSVRGISPETAARLKPDAQLLAIDVLGRHRKALAHLGLLFKHGKVGGIRA